MFIKSSKLIPFFILFLGLFLIFIFDQTIPAGICFLIGIVMIIDNVWPEKWGNER